MAFGMLNQGYYNLFLGIGAIVGAMLVMTDISGRTTLLGYCCLFMVGAAIILYVSRRSMVRGALIQGVAPAGVHGCSQFYSRVVRLRLGGPLTIISAMVILNFGYRSRRLPRSRDSSWASR